MANTVIEISEIFTQRAESTRCNYLYYERERVRDIHTYGLTALDHDGNTVQRSQSYRQGWSCRKCARTAVQPFFFFKYLLPYQKRKILLEHALH